MCSCLRVYEKRGKIKLKVTKIRWNNGQSNWLVTLLFFDDNQQRFNFQYYRFISCIAYTLKWIWWWRQWWRRQQRFILWYYTYVTPQNLKLNRRKLDNALFFALANNVMAHYLCLWLCLTVSIEVIWSFL